MNYNVDYFIKKFEAIPEEMWTTGSMGTSDDIKQKCAYGHCGARAHLGERQPQEAIALAEIIKRNAGKFYWVLSWDVVYINDNLPDNTYPQSTPKQRILAALYDIKATEAVNEVQELINLQPA